MKLVAKARQLVFRSGSKDRVKDWPGLSINTPFRRDRGRPRQGEKARAKPYVTGVQAGGKRFPRTCPNGHAQTGGCYDRRKAPALQSTGELHVEGAVGAGGLVGLKQA